MNKISLIYRESNSTKLLQNSIEKLKLGERIHIKGLAGSALSFFVNSVAINDSKIQVIILDNKEEAGYVFNDLQELLGPENVVFFPESYKRAYQIEDTDNAGVLMRTEVINKISKSEKPVIITYHNALTEKVVSKEVLNNKTLEITVGDKLDMDFVQDVLTEYEFIYDDFVFEPGSYSVRGGIIDVFSYSREKPVRIEFDDDVVASVREFDPETQLSGRKLDKITIIPNLDNKSKKETRQNLLDFIGENKLVWIRDIATSIKFCTDAMERADKEFEKLSQNIRHIKPLELFTSGEELHDILFKTRLIEFGINSYFNPTMNLNFNIESQPSFNKNFDLFFEKIKTLQQEQYKIFLVSEQEQQLKRLEAIIEEISFKNKSIKPEMGWFESVQMSLSSGLIDKDEKIAIFTDHQLFERYKRIKFQNNFSKEKALTIRQLIDLNPGDYITHIDFGIGRFAGLEILEVNGKKQETVKLLYQDNDLLYVSVHSLHKISKYSGKDANPPKVHKLGTATWATQKAKTKKKIKELAFDLIKLYAKRRLEKGFAFSPDSYIQKELEATFIYEDTPDQETATLEVKKDMEKPYPMDRLICGDVGFGKTEIAIRAAFKAVCDGKQVAVLVPTTVLAFQHFKTFSERLKDFPCTIDYINRFKSTKQQKETLSNLASGKLDIIIGTHRLVSNDVKFKDLGLLIIDEEQKFGVSVKDKLKLIKASVDSLTLTATPIPRTLQFSLMGARDMSVIRTPPPNRHPITTELKPFNHEFIRDAIMYEFERNGQVYFVSNKIENIGEIAGMIKRLCPMVKVGIAHGQLDGKDLEEVMLKFIEGEYDVIVSTAIVEAGLDIPNANTMIINNAHQFGLSDLHQLRGRVGRSNKKAFCYLIAPPMSVLSKESRLRLQSIIEFSDLGSGFNIAMKDLDIRGAGDLFGANQSGFINEIGYETYQKILNEAIAELKENEFAEIFAEELELSKKQWTDDCQIDTDLEVRIPEDYVSNITERIILYKELSNAESNKDIEIFAEKVKDRFGKIPPSLLDLMDSIKVKILAKALGIEKIIFKSGKVLIYFVCKSEYFQSETFGHILQTITPMRNIQFKQKGDKVYLSVSQIHNFHQLYLMLQDFVLEKVLD